jgi:DNA excision repair protein ERCC-2
MMIFADRRYARADKKNQLPLWIESHLEPGADNVSIDQALSIASKFYKDMGQDFVMPENFLYDSKKLEEMNIE